MLVAALAATLLGCASAARWGDEPVRRSGGWGTPETHTVRHGDTLYAIAFRYQLDYKQIACWNGIGGGYLIKPGQVLRLSPPPRRPAARESTSSSPGKPPRSASPGRPAPRPAVPPPSAAAAPYRWQWPTAGQVERGYSARSKGIEIAGTPGQRVVAAASGRVVYSGGALKGYGQLLIVKHNDTWLSAYGHNRKLRVGEGDAVTAGQHIADMGIGPSSRAVLHFEIRRNGQPVNPEQYLPKR